MDEGKWKKLITGGGKQKRGEEGGSCKWHNVEVRGRTEKKEYC